MNKFLSVFFTAAFMIGSFGAAAFAEKRSDAKQNVNDLALLLPASDAIIVGDLRRMLTEAAPQILSANPQMLAEVNRAIDEFKAKTGLDMRQFERVAVGVKYNAVAANRVNFDPVMVTRGSFNAAGLIGVAKIALKGKYREEKLGGKNLLVVSLQDVAAQLPPEAGKPNRYAQMLMKLMSGEVGFLAVDQNTLAFGSLQQMRRMTETNGKTANAELISLASKSPNAVMGFAASVPQGTAAFFNLDNDEFGNILGSLRQAYGSLDVAAGAANMIFAARTENAEQAKSLKDTLLGLQSLSGLLRARKSAKNQVLADLADSVKISQTANEVELRAAISQNGINTLLGGK